MLNHEEINKPQSTKSPQETLEPCPFCPYPTQLYFAVRGVGWQHDKEMTRRVVTICSQCGAQGPAFGVMSFNNKETATQYWNRRTSISPASATPVVDNPHPEDFCHKCGRSNIVWFAPNELWNKAVRAAQEPEILCPICFVQLAEAIGMRAAWKVAPEDDYSLNQPAVNAIQNAAQEVVDIAYRDRGQIPHRDTIIAVFTKHLTVAATAAPPVDAETFVKQWIATLQDESHVTDEDAEDLVFRIIAYKNTAAAPVEQSEHDSCSHWREGDSDNCVWRGDDLGPTDETDVNEEAR